MVSGQMGLQRQPRDMARLYLQTEDSSAARAVSPASLYQSSDAVTVGRTAGRTRRSREVVFALNMCPATVDISICRCKRTRLDRQLRGRFLGLTIAIRGASLRDADNSATSQLSSRAPH